MRHIIPFLLLCFPVCIHAQDSSNNKLQVSGYAEIYFQHRLNGSGNDPVPGFLYSHNRNNEVNLNLAFVKISRNTGSVRFNAALAAGTYMNANYTAEPATLKQVLEANVGLKISRKHNWWIDAGILPSHIGAESAISKDCPVLTRSLAAEGSPYYESGIRLSYTSRNEKWSVGSLLLNGWQHITRPAGQTKPCWGLQVQYKPFSSVLLNYSNFYGSDKPDTMRQRRLFHNLYGVFTFPGKINVTAGFDIGTEFISSGIRARYTWFSPLLLVKKEFTEKWAACFRAEYYHDPQQVIVFTGTPQGFRTGGLSANIDFSPRHNVLLRAECRLLQSRDAVFIKDNSPVKRYIVVGTSLAVSL